ncbi:Phage protein [Granulicella sibirica]|uniref:Phage protein n=2 Tax=Granulicella sibirica TaxID=2479048 RepID=A0A4Q0T647_9BACT|nr:Phage protein [Granulicella sibirica]
MRLFSVAAAFLLLGVLGSPARAQTLVPTWTQQSPATSPDNRYIHAMTYDIAHSQVVLFGGYGVNGTLNDTWLWNGTSWTLANPTNVPPARAAHAMVYDAAHGQVVMFGGFVNANTRLGDTWLWDGTNWTQAAPANSPSPRDGDVMVYDATHRQVVLFGGTTGEDQGDTWIWDGTNWTQAQPTNSPTARADYSMVYDDATGQVVLFGGDGAGYLNDTWIWDGTNWTAQAFQLSPPARYTQGMAYDAALGQAVMALGYNGNFLGDTWLYSGAAWTQNTTTPSPSGRYLPNGLTYDTAHSQVVLFGGYAGSGQLNDTWTFGLPGAYGNVNVCPSGQTLPAPCSRQLAFTYTFPAATTIAQLRSVTQGTPGLDFGNPIDTNTCVGTHAAGDTCVANVTFAPTAPGPRLGAIQFLDNSGNILSSTLLSGVGQAPAAAFGPAAQTVLNTTAIFPLSQPKGVTVDAAGNVFISDTGHQRVVKLATGGSVTTVNFGLSYPQGIAVNGSGDLFIADNDLSRVVKVPAGCTSASCEVAIGTGLTAVLGTAVDGAGNVYAAEFNTGQVVKIPPGCTSLSCQSIAYNGSNLVGVTLDSAGDLFVADYGLAKIVEVPAGCTSASCYIQVGQGWSQPEAVAVDAAGDVFVSDLGLGVVEVPAGCASTSCQVTVLSGVSAFGLAVDATGNVFIPDANTSEVYEFTRSQTPSLNFAPTNVYSTSSDSPKTFAIQNIGNQPLGAIGLGQTGGDFTASVGQGPLPDCIQANAPVLAPGGSCQVTLSFMPHSVGPSSGTFSFSDNALNVPAATQAVALSGVGLVTTVPLNVTMLGAGTGNVTDTLQQISCSEANQGSSVGTCTGNFPVGSQVTLTAAATGTSTFLGWGGVCASAGTSPTCSVTVSQAATVTASFVNQNLGSYNVCPAGQPIAGPCSNSIPVTFTLAATTTIGATRVVTQGATGLDFTQATGGTCSGTIAAGNSCTVNVNFAPIAPGLRMGAAQIFDNAGNLVGSLPVYGIGQEPAIAFGPGAQTIVNTGAFTLSQPKGLLTDAAGNLFISDADTSLHRVLKIAPDGTTSTVGVGLQFPQGIAEDGAGNFYIADNNLNEVVEVPAGCTSSACQQVIGSNYRSQLGVAVDGAGNVFFDDFLDGEVVKNPAGCASAACQTVVYNPGGGSNPVSITLDSAGNLFVADFGLRKVMEVPTGCATSACLISVGTGWSQPDGVAVDAAGNVYIADAGLNELVEVPVGCTTSSCQLVLLSGINMVATAVDATGNLFIDDLVDRSIIKLNRSQPPSFAFATTNVGSTSADSPQSFTIQSVGNQPLTGSLGLNLGGNFTPNPASTCGSAFPLAPGSICSESFSFTPQSAAFLTGTAAVSDNTLNNASPLTTQIATLSGTGSVNGQAGLATVPNVVGQPQSGATTPLTTAGLVAGTVSTASSQTVPSGTIISQNPDPGTQVSVGSAVNLLVSSGQPVVPTANPLSLENNYFLTGDYVSAGVTLRGTGINGLATGTITIPTYTQSPTGGVPDGADIVDAFLYWETLESTPTPSSANGTFNNNQITGQQIGSDIPTYTDGAFTGTLRAYRASVNIYLPAAANGIRYASGNYTITLPDGGKTALPLTEGASLVFIYRVLSPNLPLKSVVLYDGAAVPTNFPSQLVQGFYDAPAGGNTAAKTTTLFASASQWSNSVNFVPLTQSSQYSAPLNPANAYAAVILSTPVNNSDNDGILDAWKTGPAAPDFHAGQPGYYDAKTSTWVGLPGAKHGQKDLFVQLDYMCAVVNPDGSCDSTKENLFPSPDADGNDPLAMVQQAFLNSNVHLHLQVGNAVPEYTCVDPTSATPSTLCQFPNQPGVIGWKNSLEFSKLYPRNLYSCITGGDCTTRFPYGQKDSYHYLLMGHSLAIPAWNTRYGTLTSIVTSSGITTISTVDRGTGINACPSRITLSGVLGNPSLNGVYNTTGCADTKTITVATPAVPNYTYPNNTLAEPIIGLTSGTVTSISGYSDLGGADSAVTLGLWLTAPNQDMSRRANVLAGTIFHEIGHTLGLSHGGLYYDTPGSYVPTFEANCKPNYQSIMNYLFQLDLVGPNKSVAFSNQTLNTLNETSAGSVKQLTDAAGNPATFPTSAWYVPYTLGSPASPATLHCDGTPLAGEAGYRVDNSIAPITPAWTNGQDLNFTGTLQTQERGFNDLTNMDLRQTGATGGEFASLASLLYFGPSTSPLNIAAGGTVALGSGGTIALGSGGTVALGSGGNVTLGSGGTITLGSGGNVTLGSGGNVTLGSGGTVTPGSNGLVTLGSGGLIALGSGGTITLGSGGTITLGSGGTVTLGSGGIIALGSGGSPITVPTAGGTYSVDAGGTITLGSGGNVTLGSGGNITLGSGGTIALGSGGTVTLGSGGNVTLGSGGTIALGSGGTIALGSGGNVTLGSGGTIALGSGGTITLGSGGNVTLGSGGTVTLGSGGDLSASAGGTVTLGSGGNATIGAGGTITLGSGGSATVGAGGNINLSNGGTITLGSGGTITLGSGGTITLGSGGTITLGSGGAPISIGAGGSYTFGSSGGTVTLGSGGTVALGSGGTIALGSGGTIALGSGGTITLGSGGNVTLGSGGVVSLATGGSVNLGSGPAIDLGTVATSTSGSGGPPATELTYETANSVVRPPTAPTETPTQDNFVRVTWKAPAFGVVATYTVNRSSDGATPIVIGSVSGINGNPPATEFVDTNPDRTSKTVTYTITTTLVPDTAAPPRQSVPSVPAVLKNDQTIVLDPLPSSVTLANPPTVTAKALSAGVPNGLQVLFTAAGSCSIGTQTITNNVSSANVILTGTGSCTVNASQPGTTAFNAANTVSGTFMVLPQGSSTKSQRITFSTLPNVQYGSSFTLSASSSSGLQVAFTSSGPCTTGGIISGVGICTITASAPGNTTYSAASVSQSFTIYPAVLKVTAASFVVPYGQPLPALTYTYSGFVKSDMPGVISGSPVLSSTATPSIAGTYPITVSTGTLAATNYSFLYISGTLTVQPGLTLITTSPLVYNQSETMSITGDVSGGSVSYKLLSGLCSVNGVRLTANSGTGSCQVTATMAANGKVAAITSSPAIVTLSKASQTITFTTNPPASAVYKTSFRVAATSTSAGAVTFSSSGACTNAGVLYTMTAGTGTCSVIANQAGNSNYAAATQVTKYVTATIPIVAVSEPSIDFGTVYFKSVTFRSLTLTNTGTGPATITDPFLSFPRGGNSKAFLALSLCPKPLAPGRSCVVTVIFLAGGPFGTPQTATLQILSDAPGSPQSIPLTATVIDPEVSISPTSLGFGAIRHATTSTLNVTLRNPGSTPLLLTGISITGSHATSFAQSNACGTSLAPGARCTIAVTFKPPITGTFNANLTLTDNARSCDGGSQIIPLSGKAN